MDIGKRKIVIEYVLQFIEGDLEVFSYIYEICKDSIYRLAVSITKNPADAEEVVQETLIKVYYKVYQVENLDNFHTWMFSITYNTALNLKRKKMYTTISIDYSVDLPEEIKRHQSTSKEYNKKELMEIIEDKFNQLPLDLLIVAQLRYYEELKIREISEILSISATIVHRRLRRVRNYMVPELQKLGITPDLYSTLESNTSTVGNIQRYKSQNSSNENGEYEPKNDL